MFGSKYAVDVAYLENHGEIHLDAHMFFIKKIQWEHHNSDFETTVAQGRIQTVSN